MSTRSQIHSENQLTGDGIRRDLNGSLDPAIYPPAFLFESHKTNVGGEGWEGDRRIVILSIVFTRWFLSHSFVSFEISFPFILLGLPLSISDCVFQLVVCKLQEDSCLGSILFHC